MANYYELTPYIICRNRIMHGVFTRVPNKTDCLKLFHIIKAFHYLEYTYTAINKLKEYDKKITKLEKRIGITKEDKIKYNDKLIEDYIKKYSPFKLPENT